MLNNLEYLYEKYNFDYIYINQKNIDDLDFVIIPEEILTDFHNPMNYIGTIRIKESNIEVYWNPKITPGDVIFKFKDVKKERKVKLNNLFG